MIYDETADNSFGNGDTFNSNSEFVFDTMKKYIQKLEEEIVGLRKRLGV